MTSDYHIEWNRLTSKAFSPLARDGHCCAAVGRKLYVFGGVINANGELAESNELLMLDLDSSSWKRVHATGEIPSPRSAACMTAVGSILYLFGGSTQDEGWTNSLYAFDTDTQTWSLVKPSAGTPPSPRDKMAVAVVNNKLYYFGGFGPKSNTQDEEDEEEDDSDDELADLAEAQRAAKFGWFDDLFVFDPVKQSWSQPMLMSIDRPTPRAAHAMCAVGATILVFGGRDPAGRQNDLYTFDTESKKWSLIEDASGVVPDSRSFHTAVPVGKRVIVFGGRGVTDQHFNDLHVYDTEARRWHVVLASGDVPEPRGLHIAALVDDNIAIFGGSALFNEHTMSAERYFGDTFLIHTKELDQAKV